MSDKNEFNNRYNEIKSNFKNHKNEVTLLEKEDIDNAMKKTIEIGKNFVKDKNDIEELITNINEKINELSKHTFLNLGTTIVGNAINFFTRNLSTIVGNVTEIQTPKKIIQDYEEILIKIIDLKTEINQEIDKLIEKYDQLSSKHFS